MPEYLAPGVYVEEVPSGAKPIEGVSTSTAGFLGVTERGPESPQFITSWTGFQRVFGGYVPDQSYLAYAVEGFFINGGQRCFVGRVVAADAKASFKVINGLKVAAIGRGAWGDQVKVTITESTLAANADANSPQAKWRKVTITYGTVQEIFDDLTHEPGASNNLITIINSSSKLVRVWWDGNPGALSPTPPNGVKLTGGSDGGAKSKIDVAAYVGSLDPIPISIVVDDKGTADKKDDTTTVDAVPDDLLGRGSGLTALGTIDEISLLIVPDEVRSGLETISGNVIAQCENLKDRFAIVSAPQVAGDIQKISPPQDTKYAAYYYPWIKVFDPSTNFTRLIPATGHIAGIFARTDIERGVHKAPANEVVRGAVDLQMPVTKADQDMLNPRGVNCMRDFRSDGRGLRLWGARTMSSDPEWKYVNVRRLFLFVEESIDEGTQWVVFEPNDDATWAKVRRVVTNFLISVWRSGALMGLTQDEAFFVRCDRTTMTQDDIDNGRLICVIGIAPVKPAEFVIFRISQKTAEAPA